MKLRFPSIEEIQPTAVVLAVGFLVFVFDSTLKISELGRSLSTIETVVLSIGVAVALYGFAREYLVLRRVDYSPRPSVGVQLLMHEFGHQKSMHVALAKSFDNAVVLTIDSDGEFGVEWLLSRIGPTRDFVLFIRDSRRPDDESLRPFGLIVNIEGKTLVDPFDQGFFIKDKGGKFTFMMRGLGADLERRRGRIATIDEVYQTLLNDQRGR